jgi:hypothetical protein
MKFSEKPIFDHFFDFFNFIFDIKITLQFEKKIFLITGKNFLCSTFFGYIFNLNNLTFIKARILRKDSVIGRDSVF